MPPLPWQKKIGDHGFGATRSRLRGGLPRPVIPQKTRQKSRCRFARNGNSPTSLAGIQTARTSDRTKPPKSGLIRLMGFIWLRNGHFNPADGH
jgi:hypothetical protein